MLTHALGEAGSPFLVGFLIDAMEKKVISHHLFCKCHYNVDVSMCQVRESHGSYCPEMINFLAIQRSLYLPFSLLLLGGLLFLLATKWVRADKQAVDQEMM